MAALGIGTPAPDFHFVSDGAHYALSDLRGAPVVLALAATDRGRVQPALQHLTLDGERLPVVAPADRAVAEAYGIRDGHAVFVISPAGAIVWRHTLGDVPAAAPDPTASGLSRREFVAITIAGSVVAGFAAIASASPATVGEPANAVFQTTLSLIVNGRSVEVAIDPRVTLLDLLRERLHLTGSKKGCDHGQCGACTVHVDGRRVLSCLTLAATLAGRSVTTIEGLADGGTLHPMQQAFIDCDGFQCGYCTSGQIMSASALLHEPWGPSDDDVREGMSGNICRCGAYPGIVAAVQQVRRGGA